jgi:ABC-type Fe3+ transport system permease subunit
MSESVIKAVNKLGWICFISISILGFVDFDRDILLSLSIMLLAIIIMSLSAHFIGKPLRAEFDTGNASVEDVKKRLLKHPGLWLGLVTCLIITFVYRV